MELTPEELRFWDLCVASGLARPYASAYEVAMRADEAVTLRRQRMPRQLPPSSGPYRQ